MGSGREGQASLRVETREAAADDDVVCVVCVVCTWRPSPFFSPQVVETIRGNLARPAKSLKITFSPLTRIRTGCRIAIYTQLEQYHLGSPEMLTLTDYERRRSYQPLLPNYNASYDLIKGWHPYKRQSLSSTLDILHQPMNRSTPHPSNFRPEKTSLFRTFRPTITDSPSLLTRRARR